MFEIEKNPILGLYKTSVDGEWYLMRRQQEGWREAERRLLKRNMQLLEKWENVPHAIDIGNLIKKHYRQFSWYARGNTLRTNDCELDNADEHLTNIIADIISKENEAHQLAAENRTAQAV